MTRKSRQQRPSTTRLELEVLEGRLAPATFTVINTSDAGAGSFREAIVASNAAGQDRIEFNLAYGIAGHKYYLNDGIAGKVTSTNVSEVGPTGATSDAAIANIDPDWAHSWWSIRPSVTLPRFTDSVVIDGFTQGASTPDTSDDASPNTMPVGNNSVHRIEIDGSALTFEGMHFSAAGNTVRGLIVNRFNPGWFGGALVFDNDNNNIVGNFIGTDVSGTLIRDVNLGVRLGLTNNGTSNSRVGSADPGDRNVIVATPNGNHNQGILLTGHHHFIQGNYVGTNAAGTAGLAPDAIGVQFGFFTSPAHNTIGGVEPGAGNVISGNNVGVSMVNSTPVDTKIQGNLIGLDASGSFAVPNSLYGIYEDGQGTVIGGTDADDGALDGIVRARNVISGNTGSGGSAQAIRTHGSSTIIQGNFIGTDKTGSYAVANNYGISTVGASILIGGSAAGAGNLISGNTYGISKGHGFGDGGSRTIQGNLIGTNASGTAALPNSIGILLAGTTSYPQLIGGDTPAARNIISGNGTGVYLVDSSAVVQGNYIGTDITGTLALGNSNGVYVAGFFAPTERALIGGATPGSGNVIAFNNNNGVAVDLDAVDRATILGNSIHDNGAMGIELYHRNNTNVILGPTPNDLGDGDDGQYSPNALQNYPVITSATFGGGITTVFGSLNSLPGQSFRIEFFSNSFSDPSGYGEGEHYLGFTNVTTDVAGNASFSAILTIAPSGGLVTATASRLFDHDNNFATAPVPWETSEFSLNQLVVASNHRPIAEANGPYTVPEGGSVTLSSVGSHDSDGAILLYEWDLNYDGTFNVDSTNPSPVFSALNLDGPSIRTVALRVKDNLGAVSDVDTAVVNVTNLAPDALNESTTTDEDQVVSIAVLANDSDPAGALDPLQIVSVTNGTKGTTSIDTKGTATTTDDEIVYTPNAGAIGSDSFGYTISDGDGGTATATVNVEIRNLVDLSGRSFDDKDNGGLYEPGDGEVGIDGVTVQLFNETSGALIATRTTAADGSFTFDVNLVAGTYQIVAVQPAGFLDGSESAGNLGGNVDNSEDSNQITGISVGAPGTTADAVDYLFADIRPSQAQGLVWCDADNDGQVDFGEAAIAGATVEISGLDDRGNVVNRSTTADVNGIYAFLDLRPSNAAGYTMRELQPVGYGDGLDGLGTVNGATVGNGSVNDIFSAVVLPRPGSLAENYNFGERLTGEGGVSAGQTATIGFWQNNNGQNLIKALNGGSTSTQLSAWLAATFPDMYGASAGANNLTGKSNTQVAAFYKTLFARNAQSAAGGGPAKMDAQVMATAFAVYVTNQSLAGTTAAAYGFQVTANGLGTRTFNVGGNGAAFGVANSANVSVLDLLLAVNSRSKHGLLYDVDSDGDANDALETSYRTEANNVFSGINEAGDI